MTLLVLTLVVALGISFFCSLLEATLLSLTPSQIAALSERRPKVAAIWKGFKARIDRPIAVILLMNTTAHTVGASIAGAQFDELYGDRWIWIFSLALTFVMLQFTEILPKTLGVRLSAPVATASGRPLALAVKILGPVLHVIHLINRPFEGRGVKAMPSRTVDEINALAAMARLDQHISPYQERIIRGSSRLSERRVREMMIPLEQVSSLSLDQTLAQAAETAQIDAHTRYPVRQADGTIAGYLNFKEIIAHLVAHPGETDLRRVMRPVTFVHPEQPVASLLRLFVDQHEHLAVVRDDGGAMIGMVTFEDVVEELVGELEDEFDRLPRTLHALSGGVWMVGGGMKVAEVADRLKVAVPPTPLTISAWFQERLGHAPRIGECINVGGYEWTVRRVRRGKAFELAVRSESDTALDPGGSG